MMRSLFFTMVIIVFAFAEIYGQATDAPLLNEQGEKLIAAKKEEAALEKFKAALKSDPFNPKFRSRKKVLFLG